MFRNRYFLILQQPKKKRILVITKKEKNQKHPAVSLVLFHKKPRAV